MRPERLAAVAVAVGALMRAIAYASHPSLWLDESMLALNVAERSFGGLTQPLAMSQVAPIPFLWLLKAATLLGGVNELSLRIVPLLAGVTLLGAQWWVTRRMLGASVAVAAVTLAAVSPILLAYSTEVKQYELDALVTLAVLGFVVAVRDAPDDPGRWRWLGVGGVVCLALSQPAVFVLAGATGALLLDHQVRAAPQWGRRVLALGVVWLVTFGLLYALVYRSAANPRLYRTWGDTFLTPQSPDLLARLIRAGRTAVALGLPDALATQSAWVAGSALLVGLCILWRRHGAAIPALIVGPFAAVLAASALGKYPVAARVLVFTVPLWMLGYAAALEWVGRVLPQRVRHYAWTGALLGFGLIALYGDRDAPWTLRVREDARGVIGRVAQGQGDDPVYVLNEGLPLWAFYTTDWTAPDTRQSARIRQVSFRTRERLQRETPALLDSLVLRDSVTQRVTVLGLASPAQWREGRGWIGAPRDSAWAITEAARIRTTAPSHRVWIVACHERPDQTRLLLGELKRLGATIAYVETAPGAVAYRLRFTREAPLLATATRAAPSPSAMSP